MKSAFRWITFLCALMLRDPAAAADGDWTGGGVSPLDYWDASNWRDGQIAHGAGSAAYFTNNLPDKLLLTNDVTLGYLQLIAPAASGTPITVEGASVT
ncbi:MAG: hypothetical protein GX748_14465, partial [Lentisphaerae bacterium]|nr:hypothetical protein [Lentisphaerota bacterium]